MNKQAKEFFVEKCRINLGLESNNLGNNLIEETFMFLKENYDEMKEIV